MYCSVMLSAGLDSTTLWYELVKEGKRPRAIYLNAGQKSHDNQVYYARYHSLKLDLPLDVVQAPNYLDGLTLPPHNRVAEALQDLPICGDSCSSMTIAAVHAATSGSERLYTGYTAEDAKRLPGLDRMLALAAEMVAISAGNTAFQIEAPYLKLAKADIVKRAQGLPLSLNTTWSCLWSGELHCGRCARCQDRKAAFAEARFEDPTRYSE